MVLFLAINNFVNSLFFWDKNQLKELDDYIINNDIEHIITAYELQSNEYIRDIIYYRYKENLTYDEIALKVPYSRNRINEIVIDFKKYILYHNSLNNI